MERVAIFEFHDSSINYLESTHMEPHLEGGKPGDDYRQACGAE